MSSPIALSPDGTRLVYTAESSDGTQLYVRSLDRFDARPIPGTEDAFSPFLSPDGQWVGFFARNELRKVSLASGAQFKICDTPSTSQSMSTAIQGASWGPDGTIVFAAGARSWGSPSGTASGLFRVSSDGGVVEVLASPDEEQGERGYWWPQVLPDDLGVLFTVWGTATGDSRIELLSLDTGETRTLLHEGSGGRYLPTGHLVFSQDAQLVAVPFDTAGLEVTGPPMPVPEDIYTSPRSGLAYFTVSATGSLAYVPGTFSESVLMLVDGEGKAARIVSEGAAGFVHPRFSPDGRRIAADAFVAGKRDIWVYEIERGTRTRLTVEGTNRLPVWTRDGNHITYGSTSTGSWELLSAPADGSGEARSLLKGNHNPISWSPDDRALALAMLSTEGGRDIWVLPAGGDPEVFLATAFDERSPTFSPDGRWLVYVSDESGRDEVYVRPYPGTGVRGKWPVSSEGGREPVWSASGGELFYRNGNWMMAVAVETDPTFRLGKPRRLFEAEYYLDRDGHPAYGVSPDGKFVMVEDIQQKPTQVRVVLNWFEELADLAPTSSR
jgi:serine/threonine-protein kinase